MHRYRSWNAPGHRTSRLFSMPLRFRPPALLALAGAAACAACATDRPDSGGAPVRPTVVTEPVHADADDPALWIDPADPSRSLVIATDKGDADGGVYAFDLDGRIDSAKTRRPLRRPNNVDVLQGVTLGGERLDLAVATERGAQAIRVFRLPDMTPIDGGGIPVFDGDGSRAPMGVALYRRARDGAVYAIVGGKSGPTEGYLVQLRLDRGADGVVTGTPVRSFGRYSGRKEIEAIAVDQMLGYVYYSDETVGIRKYHADPDHPEAGRELALFGTTGFVEDHEGIAIYPRSDSTGYLVVSDQQGGRIQLFPREGQPGAPHEHPVLAVVPVAARETDGLEVTATPLPPRFPAGVLVMMSTDRTFHLYDWRLIQARIDSRDQTVTK